MRAVRKDSLFSNGRTYYYFTISGVMDGMYRGFLRLDSATANVYRLANEVNFTEVLIESLRARPGDLFVRDTWDVIQCISVDTVVIFGRPVIAKHFHSDSPIPGGREYTLALGLGCIQNTTYREDPVYPILLPESYDLTYANVGNETFGVFVHVQEESPQIPTDIGLSPTYPNPFNGESTISISLAVGQYINIDLYGILGEKVALIFEGLLPSGTHNIRWNGDEIPSGTYIVRLQAGSRVLSQKAIHLR
jgi:hypothetical protein